MSISIHALLAESDNLRSYQPSRGMISIHALLAESDRSTLQMRRSLILFLSTLSLRRATASLRLLRPTTVHFYPRSPCGERRDQVVFLASRKVFLSTLSLRRATGNCRKVAELIQNFYPRSPCGERLFSSFNLASLVYFYPRSPCGERHGLRHRCASFCIISIHALLAESDHAVILTHSTQTIISIHALLAESDRAVNV